MAAEDMSDHDVLMEIRGTVTDIQSALLGTLNGKPGLIFRFNQHIQGHRKLERCIYGALGSGVVATIVIEVLRHFRFI